MRTNFLQKNKKTFKAVSFACKVVDKTMLVYVVWIIPPKSLLKLSAALLVTGLDRSAQLFWLFILEIMIPMALGSI